MKKFISILLIMTLLCGMFAVNSISVYAEEIVDESVDNVGDAEQDTTTDEEVDQPVVEEESAPFEEESSFIMSLLGKFIPMEALGRLKDALFGFVEKMWEFIQSNETYSNIATAVIALLAVLALPLVVGGVVIIYAIVGGMIIFAGALTATVELFIGMV
jgi:hypothetical protein